MADTLQFELDINDTGSPTAEQVLEYRCPTSGYMCPLTANTYGLDFLSFRIRDYGTSKQLFEVARDPDAPPVDISQIPPEMEDQVRCISYDFGADFLNLEMIGTTLEFSVGPREVEEFRMIERHYFRDTLIKSYDFMFGFCIPNSTNTWEAIYDMPELPEDLQQAMMDNPWETESDSFYFVGETMIMHNKVRETPSAAPTLRCPALAATAPPLPRVAPCPGPPRLAAPHPTRPPTCTDRPSTPTQDREGARRGLEAAKGGVVFTMRDIVVCLGVPPCTIQSVLGCLFWIILHPFSVQHGAGRSFRGGGDIARAAHELARAAGRARRGRRRCGGRDAETRRVPGGGDELCSVHSHSYVIVV